MNTTVLIASCDDFADCHAPALACLAKFWGDCPYTIRTLSNHKPWGKNPLLVGIDHGWANNMKAALDQIETPFVILTLEDMFVCRPVDTAAVHKAESVMEQNQKIGAIRLGQGAEKTTPLDNAYSLVCLDSDYRISTSATLWRKDYLNAILENCQKEATENPDLHLGTAWAFEIDGTEFSKTLPDEIWVPYGPDDTTRPMRAYYTGITKGRWDPRCIAWLKSIGIEVEDQSRGFMQLP